MFESFTEVLITHFLAYGLIGVAVLCILDGLLIGKFLPVNIIVPLAALLRGDSFEWVGAVVAVAVLGYTIGQCLLFLIVRREGRDFVVSSPRIRINRAHLRRGDRYFKSYGLPSVAVTNALPIVRGLATIPAGLADAPTWKFAIAAGLGAAVYYIALIAGVIGIGTYVL